jgi:hypothetical protein
VKLVRNFRIPYKARSPVSPYIFWGLPHGEDIILHLGAVYRICFFKTLIYMAKDYLKFPLFISYLRQGREGWFKF